MVALPGHTHLDIKMAVLVSRLSFIKGSLLIGRVWLAATSRSPARMSRMHLRVRGTCNKMHVWVLDFAMLICASVNNLIEMPELLPVKPGCGALQGTTGAVDIFQDVYHPAVDSWLQRVESADFLVRDPVSGEMLDLCITSNADDVTKGKLFKDGQELQQLILAEDMVLSDSLQRICTAQHTGKQEHTVSMWGRGSWADMQRIYTAGLLTGGVVTSIKYLGSWLHHEGRQAQEITFRINAAKEAWSRLGGFWYKSGTSKRARIMVFKSLILSTLFCGLETMVMSPAEYQRLDVCILGFVRKLMRGTATSKTVTDPGTPFRTLPVQEQRRWVGLSPSAIELRIARLGLLQRVSNNPYGCRAFIAALFGRFAF